MVGLRFDKSLRGPAKDGDDDDDIDNYLVDKDHGGRVAHGVERSRAIYWRPAELLMMMMMINLVGEDDDSIV